MADRAPRFCPHNQVDNRSWSAALYVRLSNEDGDKSGKEDLSLSIKNQTSFLKAFVEKYNREASEWEIRIYEVFADDDFTGMNFDRIAFRKMMREVEAGIVDCIIVKSLSRFGRYDTEMQTYMEKTFEKRGREVRFIAVGDNYDSLYDELDMLTKIKLIINREYSEQQHKNVSIAMRSMQLEGLYVGAFAPYGYRKDAGNKNKLVIDGYAAEIVRRIFREYLRGVSAKEIAIGLTGDGIVNRATYKRLTGSGFAGSGKISEKEVHWTPDAVKQVLMNEVYTGTMVQGKTEKRRLIDVRPTAIERENWIRVENTHEAIVSREEWEWAGALMKKIGRDAAEPEEVTIFKGVLKCGDCGHAMRKKWDKYIAGRTGEEHRYLYYNCGTFRDYSGLKGRIPNMPSCTCHYISDKVLRNLVLADLNTLISQMRDLEGMAKRVQRESGGAVAAGSAEEEIALRRKCMEQNRKRIQRAEDKWYDDKISDAEFAEVRARYEGANGVYEKEIALLEKNRADAGAEKENAWMEELLARGGIAEPDRATVLCLIDRIAVFEDGHIEITYKFSGEYENSFLPGTEESC